MQETPTHDIRIVEGEDFQTSLQLLTDGAPDNLAGAMFLGQIRAGFADTDPVLATFTFTTPVPASGEVFISLAAVDAAGLSALIDPYSPRRPTGYYDWFVTLAGSTKEYLAGGRVVYQPTISRSA